MKPREKQAYVRLAESVPAAPADMERLVEQQARRAVRRQRRKERHA